MQALTALLTCLPGLAFKTTTTWSSLLALGLLARRWTIWKRLIMGIISFWITVFCLSSCTRFSLVSFLSNGIFFLHFLCCFWLQFFQQFWNWIFERLCFFLLVLLGLDFRRNGPGTTIIMSRLSMILTSKDGCVQPNSSQATSIAQHLRNPRQLITVNYPKWARPSQGNNAVMLADNCLRMHACSWPKSGINQRVECNWWPC